MNYPCELPKFCVVNDAGDNLFHINYVPPIGSTLHYYVERHMVHAHQQQHKGTGKEFSEDAIKFWKSIDGKYWTVKDVYCEVRNYGGKEVPVHFVMVDPKEDGEPA